MDFGLSEEQAMFQEALSGYLAERVPPERVRTVMESDDGHDADVIVGLAEQGATGILVPAEYGGSELGLLDAVIAAEELGRAAAPYSFHCAAVMAPYLIAASSSEEPKSRWLTALAAGKAHLSVALAAREVRKGRLSGKVDFVSDVATADAFIVQAGQEGGGELYVVPRDAAGVSFTALSTVDETRRIGELVFEDTPVDDSMRLLVDDAAAVVERALDAGRIALAADALGAAEKSLQLAVAYSLTREQFGRVIGSFQAVKHMCAETFAEMEPVRSLLWYAAFAWDEQLADAPYVAALVKSHAVEMATQATTTCVQVHGGIGFTYECDMQIWFKRAGYDYQVLGAPAALRERAAEIEFGPV